MCWTMVPFVILGILFVIGITVLIVVAITRAARASSPSANLVESPLAILKRRYAQGDLLPEQFEAMKQRSSAGRETMRDCDGRNDRAVHPVDGSNE